MKLLERASKGSENKNRVRGRIAVYDTQKAPPRLIKIDEGSCADLIESLATTTYRECQQKGSSFPYVVLRETIENLIHANFAEIVVSVLDNGNTVRVTDQGPGVEDVHRAFEPGFTTATHEMKRYIRGVGSGLPVIKEIMTFSGGRVEIGKNLGCGTVVTLRLPREKSSPEPSLSKRQASILSLVTELGSAGPSDVSRELGAGLSTVHRELTLLEEKGLLKSNEQGKRYCTQKGLSCLNKTVAPGIEQ